MRVYHLNCGTHCPIGGAFFDGTSRGPFASICTHVLLVETDHGLVLVDTGYGLSDVRNNPRRLARTWPLILNPRLRASDTAAHQIRALGFSLDDVRHIVLTHLDFDHAGGISDFPMARLHVMANEFQAAGHARRSFVDNQRYRPSMWQGERDWRTYRTMGDHWFGFNAVRELDGLPPDILMIPLRGHTVGHAGVAVRTGSGWLLHAGDAFMHHSQLHARDQMPPGLRLYERIMMTDGDSGAHNLERLRALHHDSPDVTVICSHDHHQLHQMKLAGDDLIVSA